MSRVAVVGTGAMGSRIARRLLRSGHRVTVWSRTPGRVGELVEAGADDAGSPAEAAAGADVVITMVTDAAALAAVTVGPDGIASAAHADLTLVQMATVGGTAIRRLARMLPPTIRLVDAPVLGSLHEAETGTLTIFIGGRDDAIERAQGVLTDLGTVRRVGGVGAGAAAKLVANAALFGALATLGEVLLLGKRLDLDADTVFDVLSATPLAAQATRRRPAIDAGTYPTRFALSLARKDADLVAAEVAPTAAELRVLEAARSWLVDAEAAGWGDHDYTAITATILGQPPRRRSDDEDPDGLIIDLDGVVWIGGQPIEGAAAALRAFHAQGTRVVFLTNDPQTARAAQASRLRALGIPATSDDVVTSAAATARHVAARHPRAGVLVIGSAALHDEIAQAGLSVVAVAEAHAADVVVVGGHREFGYIELAAATTALRNGAALYATGRDPVVPGMHGPEPATGAILAAIETAGGVSATVLGKPERHIFAVAQERLDGCQRVVVIGDNLASDIAGAHAAGLDAVLVLTGATSEHDLARSRIQPDRVVPDLSAMLAGR
jgi:3-hydroxyisobutyrate dehydrogenase